ncbi:MAG: class III extradiol ring-cleavage dioxygenase, partial [Planctomycetota bacterium]
PEAILVVSAHWWTRGTLLTGDPTPKTIHDFSGFPRPLHEVRYPAPGSPDLAARAARLVASVVGSEVEISTDWGLDHGSWSVLLHLYPEADVPVLQLSLNSQLGPAQHFELGQALAPLRYEGVLILGSGNITHNLRDALVRASSDDPSTPAWAAAFDQRVSRALVERDSAGLIETWPDGQGARQAHPHPDHWLPLLYAYAAAGPDDSVSFPTEGFELGSLSMRSVLWEA